MSGTIPKAFGAMMILAKRMAPGIENPQDDKRKTSGKNGEISKDGKIEGEDGKASKKRKVSCGENKIDEEIKIEDQDGQTDDEYDLMPELEEDGDANSDDCSSNDFSSECSSGDSDSDDEVLPTIHEMNHDDKWQLVEKKGHCTLYKNGIIIYEGFPPPCKCAPKEGGFMRYRLLLERQPGLRGEIEWQILHHRYVSRPTSRYTADFEGSQLIWEQSLEHAALKSFLESMSAGKIRITNIVCFCLGSLQTDSHKPWKCRKSSRIQLAILLTIARLLGSQSGGNEIKCIAQDPDFSVIDKRFMKQTCGITVVDDPQGFAVINENTLVFMMGGFSPLHYVMSRGPRPAAFIMNEFKRRGLPSIKIHKREAKMGGEPDYLQRVIAYEEDSVEDMLKGCEGQAFPDSGGYASHAMNDAHVYWRRA